jgi:outer membrane autotransporter protein
MRSIRRLMLLATVSVLGIASSGSAHAGCDSAASAGNDTLLCSAATTPDPTVTPIDLLAGTDQITVTSGTYSGGITGGAGTKTVNLQGGTIASYSNTAGTTILTFTSGSTANVTGNVTTGAGNDRFELQGGTVGGFVDQGDGVNAFVISGGRVVGAVSQGSGIDDFQMTGGEIASLNQGQGYDTFFMSGGTILGAFEDGDRAVMTGGTIDRVDMKLADNYFNMSGGRINKNLVAGFGNDEIILSNGSIGGNISVSDGADKVTVTGGSVGGEIRMGTGNYDDVFTWDGGGSISGKVEMGGGNDTVTLRDLTAANLVNLANGKTIDGGDGIDSLTLGGTGTQSTINASLVVKFEDLVKTDAGTWTLSGSLTDIQTATVEAGTLILTGDNAAYAGTMTVDPAGTLQAGAESLTPTVANEGLVRIAQTGTGTYAGVISGSGALEKTGAGTAILTATQTYTGTTDILAGALAVGDAANPAAALIGGGAISVSGGATLGGYGRVMGPVANEGTIAVADALLGGGGAGQFTILGTLTNSGVAQIGGAGVGNHLVVSNYVGEGGTVVLNTELGSDGSPSDTLIIDGGTASGTSKLAINNVGGTGSATVADGILVVEAINGGTTAAGAFSLAGPVAAGAFDYRLYRGDAASDGDNWYLRNYVEAPGGGETLLYRPEASLYAPVPAMARQIGLSTLGTFHERQGEQSILDGQGRLPGGWARVFGGSTEQHWSGTLDPEFDGTIWGFQTGADIYAIERPSGHEDRFGAFFGYAQAEGDGRGFALGVDRFEVGSLNLDSYALGGYWTHLGPSGWYIDTVLMTNWIGGGPSSTRGVGADLDGTLFTASVEGGYPIALGGGLTLEPQAQVIWQNLSMDQTSDIYSSVDYGSSDAFTGRFGARLQGDVQLESALLKPYLKLNLWHDFSRADDVALGADVISTDYGNTTLEVGGGVVAELNKTVSLYATGGYTKDVGGAYEEGINGNLGLRLTW